MDLIREDGERNNTGIGVFKRPGAPAICLNSLEVAASDPLEDSLRVLCTFQNTQSRPFQAAVDELLDHAFASRVGGKHCAPGRNYLEHIIATLRGRNMSADAPNDVANIMLRAWQQQMAKWVGEAITNSHELQEALSSLVAALPFRSDDNGDLIGFPEDAKHALLLLSSSSSQRSNHVTPPHAVRNVQIDQRPSQQTPTGLNRIQLAPSPESVQPEFFVYPEMCWRKRHKLSRRDSTKMRHPEILLPATV